MAKRLKLKLTSSSPESLMAMEYECDSYFSYARGSEVPNVSWQSPALPTEAVIGLLRQRGWHTTDIADELSEARKFFVAAA